MFDKISKLKVNKILKDAVKSKKLVLGTDKAKKGSKSNVFSTVILVSNTPNNIRNDLLNFTKISKTKILEAPINSAELGELCGKPFRVLIAGIKK